MSCRGWYETSPTICRVIKFCMVTYLIPAKRFACCRLRKLVQCKTVFW